ncbi:hypothetical protein NHX12_023151 [Muraenolepis orangiensis]|uniref:Uncharacterized protein n=1 Tax=Muraenolepis orangiensis TaxID=630683 RepID=A0A9Q0IRS9_9TELE|nr:hypothetical protein NHX12_023151 [Muraenolepis orangiensis]
MSGTRAGTPNESLLYQSLKVYLDNKTRQQPIIGLNSVTECVKAGSGGQETLYLCEVCNSRMKRMDVRNHIMGTLHRYCYIKARHPDLATGWGQTVDVPKLAWPLLELASVLEKREGPGIVQVVQLDAMAFHAMGQNSAAGGLDYVVEYRSKEGGYWSCFLCHCCRVKCHRGDIIEHLTSSTHISNYLMEAYPECVEAMMGGLNGEKDLLQALARRVLEWPAHCGNQLSDKTYHWCIKMFSNGENWRSPARPKNTVCFKGSEAPHTPTTPTEGVEVESKQAAKKRRTGNDTAPVFKVSMPMTRGAFVLERVSFGVPQPAAAPPSEALAPNSHLDFGSMTVTVYKPPSPAPACATAPERHIEVGCPKAEESISVVIGRRVGMEEGCGTERYQHSYHGLDSCHVDPPNPEKKPQNLPDAPTRVLQHRPPTTEATGPPADAPDPPCSREAEADHVTPKTLSSSLFFSAQSDFRQKKKPVTFYYCTPNGQQQSIN